MQARQVHDSSTELSQLHEVEIHTPLFILAQYNSDCIGCRVMMPSSALQHARNSS
jgi:hypothetical protein